MSDKGKGKAVEKPDISDEEYERECLLYLVIASSIDLPGDTILTT